MELLLFIYIFVLLFKIQFDDIKMEIGDDDDNGDDKVSFPFSLNLFVL